MNQRFLKGFDFFRKGFSYAPAKEKPQSIRPDFVYGSLSHRPNPLLFTRWQMGLFRKPIDVDAAPLVRSNSHVLRVAVAGDFAPHSFVNKEGQLSGMDVEILYHLANRMQRKLELFTGDWPTCRNMLRDGKVDVLSDLEIYSNMQDVVKTIPTSADSMRVFGKKPVNHVSQLSGKRVAIMKNSVHFRH